MIAETGIVEMGVLLAGIAVLGLTSFDLIAVTIGATTRYTVTNAIARGVFAVLRRIARLGAERLLVALSGIVVMTAVAAFWIGGTWLGWSLIYGAVDGSIEMGTTGAEPEPLDAAAHAGHLLGTLGGARTEPGGLLWGLLGVFVGVNGMVVLTLSVSFLLSVRQTVQDGRAFAALRDVDALGSDGAPERLAELISGLHAAPFALWYGNLRVERQLPAALLEHARLMEAQGGRAWARVAELMRDLPHLDHDVPRAGLIEALETWAQSHTIADLDKEGDGAVREHRPA